MICCFCCPENAIENPEKYGVDFQNKYIITYHDYYKYKNNKLEKDNSIDLMAKFEANVMRKLIRVTSTSNNGQVELHVQNSMNAVI